MDDIFCFEENELHPLLKIKLFVRSNYYSYDSCLSIIYNVDKLFTTLYNICDEKMKNGSYENIQNWEVDLELIKLSLASVNFHIENCFVFNVIFNKIEYFI